MSYIQNEIHEIKKTLDKVFGEEDTDILCLARVEEFNKRTLDLSEWHTITQEAEQIVQVSGRKIFTVLLCG